MDRILETRSLVLRLFTINDAEFLLKLVNSEGWLTYIGNRGVRTIEEAQIYLLTGPLSAYEKQGFGLYAVELKSSGIPIGMCGLIKREGLEDVDIGFAFLPEYTGKGFAFEAAWATLKFGLHVLNIPRIVSITLDHNARAIRLLEKLGLQFQKKIRLPHEEQDMMLFG